MALSKKSVETAWYILNEINPAAKNSWIQEYDENEPLKTDTILGYDKKRDDGWESVYMNVKNITPEQKAIFIRREKEVPNSSIYRDKGDGITRIGWF